LDLLIPLLASAIPLVLDANEEKRNPVPSNGSEEQSTGQKIKCTEDPEIGEKHTVNDWPGFCLHTR
jgi:hypothetical protein